MYFNVNQIASILHVNSETVRRWIRESKIRATIRRGRGGSEIHITALIEFVNNTPSTTPFKMLFETWCIQNNVDPYTGTIINGSTTPVKDENVVIDDDFLKLINNEKMNLCILRQKLARIQAEITIRENQIEYYMLMMTKEEK